jgi:elongation factor G
MRVYSGTLDAGSYVNTRSGKQGADFPPVPDARQQAEADRQGRSGDIAAAVGFKDIRTGDTLCDEKNPIVLESMVFPDPVIGVAVEPKSQKDLDKLGMALAKLAEEDPTFRCVRRRHQPDRY